MDVKVIFDYKVVLALGVTVVGIIFASKLDPAAVEEVSICAIGTAESFASACKRISGAA